MVPSQSGPPPWVIRVITDQVYEGLGNHKKKFIVSNMLLFIDVSVGLGMSFPLNSPAAGLSDAVRER